MKSDRLPDWGTESQNWPLDCVFKRYTIQEPTPTVRPSRAPAAQVATGLAGLTVYVDSCCTCWSKNSY